jgi:hypothetical protein
MIEFRVGQKVVCVDVSGLFETLRGEFVDSVDLTKGAVYTIRWLGIFEGQPVVRLREITERTVPSGYLIAPGADRDTPFLASRFRPLVERKTDISVFTKMLRDQEALV